MNQQELSSYEELQANNAHHRALILRILKDHPGGLTTQQIIQKENDYYKYCFLTDNRLRELRQLNMIKSVKNVDGLLRWSRME